MLLCCRFWFEQFCSNVLCKTWKLHCILQVSYGIDLSGVIFPTLSETLGCFIVNHTQKSKIKKPKTSSTTNLRNNAQIHGPSRTSLYLKQLLFLSPTAVIGDPPVHAKICRENPFKLQKPDLASFMHRPNFSRGWRWAERHPQTPNS